MRAGWLRPLGFLALMVGFGLRLDAGWDRLAALLLAAGAVAAVVGLAAPRTVPPAGPGEPASAGAPRASTPDGDRG